MNHETRPFPALITPDAPLAPGVSVGTSSRAGGFSAPPWDSLNLGLNSGDAEPVVQRNREYLAERVGMTEPVWLHQCHGTSVLALSSGARTPGLSGDYVSAYDAAWTDEPGRVLVVLTADCLPVAIASHDGSEVAVAHAGWRGLAGGIIENTIAQFRHSPDALSVWLGPAIGPERFEVGDDVRDAFLTVTDNPAGTAAAFTPRDVGGKWLADLYALARLRLNSLGVHRVSGGHYCTYTDQARFYSYRRDGAASGRMGTFIWRHPSG